MTMVVAFCWGKRYILTMNADKIEKLFWALVLLWVLVRVVLLVAELQGNTDSTYVAEVMRYFSDEEVNAGREFAMYGFWFKTIYGFVYAFTLIFLLKAGCFAKLYQWCVEICGAGLFKSEILFALLFLTLLKILSFPSAFFFGYWRESVMGFATQGIGGWLVRYVKAVGINMLLQVFTIMVVISVLKYFPTRWPFIMPTSIGVIAVVVVLLSPLLITPLFYEQKPLGQGAFRDRLINLASNAGMKIDEIYVVDESRYSRRTNAYFTGIGSHKRIVLYDNLINNHSEDEVMLIFAHEAGHWKYSHVTWGLSLGVLGAFFASVLVYYMFPMLAQVKIFGLSSQIATTANLPFFVVMMLLLQLLVIAPVESQISQFMERQADATALQLSGLKEAYINANRKLAIDNRSNLLPHYLRVFWLYSHPPAVERIRMAESDDAFLTVE